jgi:hypothetical protein
MKAYIDRHLNGPFRENWKMGNLYRSGVAKVVAVIVIVAIILGAGIPAAYLLSTSPSSSSSPTISPTSSPTTFLTASPSLTNAQTPSFSPNPTITSTPGPSQTATSQPTSSPTPTHAATHTPAPTVVTTPTEAPTSAPTTAAPTNYPTPTPKPAPTITLTSSSATVESGATITVTGTVSPSKSGTIDLAYAIGSSGFIYHRNRTITSGEFSDTYGVLDLTTWQFKATWAGDDSSSPAESNIVSVTVVKSNPTLTLSTDSTTRNINQAVTLTCYLSIMRSGNVTLDWAIGSSGFIYHSNEVMTNHVFTRTFGFGQNGTWQFRVNWTGDSTSNSATSNVATVTVTP